MEALREMAKPTPPPSAQQPPTHTHTRSLPRSRRIGILCTSISHTGSFFLPRSLWHSSSLIKIQRFALTQVENPSQRRGWYIKCLSFLLSDC